jgi:hypothetical protein
MMAIYSQTCCEEEGQLIVSCIGDRNILYEINYIVTCIPIARQQLGKHIPKRTNERENRKPIARQRISKHAMGSVKSGYKEVFSSTE